MARRIAGGPFPAAAGGLLALVVLAGFLGLTLTADRLLRESPAGSLLDTPALTISPDLAASTATLRGQAQSPSERIRLTGTLLRAAVASVGEAIGPALVAASVPAQVVAVVTAVEPAGSTLGDQTPVAGLKNSGKAGSKGKKGSVGASGTRGSSGILTASSDRKEDSKGKEKAAEPVAAAGGTEKGPGKGLE